MKRAGMKVTRPEMRAEDTALVRTIGRGAMPAPRCQEGSDEVENRK